MNTGKIVKISGPVVDCAFPSGALPKIKEALTVTVGGKTRTMEVAQHIGGGTVRCILLAESENLSLGDEVTALGTGIRVPVGEATLGRMFNVFGETIDGGVPIPDDVTRASIHRKPPEFVSQSPSAEILETGIKVIDL